MPGDNPLMFGEDDEKDEGPVQLTVYVGNPPVMEVFTDPLLAPLHVILLTVKLMAILLTLIFACLFMLQVLAVVLSVYIVVTDGDAMVFGVFVLLNPAVGNQEKALPPPVVISDTDCPIQMESIFGVTVVNNESCI